MKKIKLSQGQIAVIDDVDFDLISKVKWFADKRKYTYYAVANLSLGGRKHARIMMHRLIMGLGKGDGLQVDHIDGNGLNNRRANLRVCTRQQNQMNMISRCAGKTSQYKGVYFHINRQKWYAQIKVNGKIKHIGSFDTENNAGRAYNRKAVEYYGEYAKTNKIVEV